MSEVTSESREEQGSEIYLEPTVEFTADPLGGIQPDNNDNNNICPSGGC